MCRPKRVKQLRNIGIINSTTWLHLVGSFYEIYITMHGSMNINSNWSYFLYILKRFHTRRLKHNILYIISTETIAYIYIYIYILITKACWLNRSKLLTKRHESEQKRTALFWVITQRVVVNSYRRFGQPIGPISKGKEFF